MIHKSPYEISLLHEAGLHTDDKSKWHSVIVNRLLDDLYLNGMAVWTLLEHTGDEEITSSTFDKAAELVLDDNFTLLKDQP